MPRGRCLARLRIREVIVSVVQVEAARRQVGVLCDLAVEVNGPVQGDAGAEHAYVEVDHHPQRLLPLLRHIAQDLHVRGGAGNRADGRLCLRQFGEAQHFAFLHQWIGQNGFLCAGVEDHFQFLERGAFEPGDAGRELFARYIYGLVGLDVDEQMLAAAG